MLGKGLSTEPPKKETKRPEHPKCWQLERIASSSLFQKELHYYYISFIRILNPIKHKKLS